MSKEKWSENCIQREKKWSENYIQREKLVQLREILFSTKEQSHAGCLFHWIILHQWASSFFKLPNIFFSQYTFFFLSWNNMQES